MRGASDGDDMVLELRREDDDVEVEDCPTVLTLHATDFVAQRLLDLFSH
jgi:hypothetical protein